MSKKEFVLKGRAETDGMAALLDDVLKCFKAGVICLSNGREHLTLKPAPSVDFVIEGQNRKGRQKLVVEMSWTEGAQTEAAPVISISSVEPEPEAEASCEAPCEASCETPAGALASAAVADQAAPGDFIGSVPPVEEKKEKPEKKGKNS